MDAATEWMQNPQLDGDEFFWPGNEIGFLLIHGFTATTAEVHPLAEVLREKGYTVSAPLLPGHGTTPDDMNSKKWKDWTMYVEQSYQQLASKCRVVFVGGESMGGLLALYLAASHPEVNGILLYAPALKVPKLGRAGILSLFKSVQWKKGGDDGMPWKGYRVVPLKASRQLGLLQKQVIRLLPAVKQPALICQGRLDQTIDPRGVNILMKRIGSTDKQLLWYDHSHHCILLDQEFDSVTRVTLSFIDHVIHTHHAEEAL